MHSRILHHFCSSLLVALLLTATLSRVHSQTWASQGSPVYGWYSAVQFLTNQIGYVSGAEGVILKTTNAGAAWVRQTSGTSKHFSDHFFVDVNTGWVVGQDGVIEKTTDGGATWSSQSSGTTSWLNVVRFVNPQIGWAAGTNGVVIKTTDGGTTWWLQTTGITKTIEGGWFVSSSAGFFVGEDGYVCSTTNGGATWTLQWVSPTDRFEGIQFVNSSVGWIVGTGGRILKTTNGGASWSSQTSGTSEILNEVSFANADTGWAVGNGGTIIATYNGGATWQSQFSFTTENLRSVFFYDPRHGWSVGLNNQILEYALVHSLPIQLSRFVATTINAQTVRLDWTTASEINNYGFYVQRSAEPSSGFIALGGSFIPGHGTTNSPHNYTFTDNSALPGRWYYRLQQIDLDGTINYSEPISVDILTGVASGSQPAVFSLAQNYPNPFNPSTKIQFSIPAAGIVALKVYDMQGRELATIVNEELNAGVYTRTFSGNNFASGTYFYKLSAGQYTATKKFILAK